MFFKKFRLFQKFPVRKSTSFSKLRLLTQNSVFFKKFRTFQKIPRFSKKYVFFKKKKKSRLLTQNTIHRHKHLFFPNAFWYICHSLPHSTSKSCRIHAFNRTISTFDINYRDQKVLCIANLIPVGRPRTNFRTF